MGIANKLIGPKSLILKDKWQCIRILGVRGISDFIFVWTTSTKNQ